MKTVSLVVLVIVVSLIVNIVTSSLLNSSLAQDTEKTTEQLRKEFYDVETSVLVSPHGLRKHIADKLHNIWLVDLRSQEEYEEEHIVGAVSIPAYKDKDHSDYGAVKRIVSGFEKLQKQDANKDIIVYCYSMACMTGRKVGKILSDNGIYVKELGIGWNEWRYQWDTWNHAHEWNNTDVMDYIAIGSEPGEPPGTVSGSGCSIGGLGC